MLKMMMGEITRNPARPGVFQGDPLTMHALITCPHCCRPVRVLESALDQAVRCPLCGAIFVPQGTLSATMTAPGAPSVSATVPASQEARPVPDLLPTVTLPPTLTPSAPSPGQTEAFTFVPPGSTRPASRETGFPWRPLVRVIGVLACLILAPTLVTAVLVGWRYGALPAFLVTVQGILMTAVVASGSVLAVLFIRNLAGGGNTAVQVAGLVVVVPLLLVLGVVAFRFFLGLTRESVEANKQAEREAWPVFAPPGEGFRVQMPGTPTLREEVQSSPHGDVPVRLYVYRDERSGNVYIAGYLEFRPVEGATQLTDAERFRIARPRMAAVVGGQIKRDETDLQAELGAPARELGFEVGGLEVARGRMASVGSRVYIVLLHAPRPGPFHEAAQHFFSSFRLTGEP
jgi:hypothetical protein